jgi:hypothetical protein
MLKVTVTTALLVAAVACGAAHGPAAVSESPTSGLVLDNDTADAVTLRGCASCGSGQTVPAGARWGFTLASNSSRVELDEAGSQTRCLTIMQGIATDKATVVKVSDAGAC